MLSAPFAAGVEEEDDGQVVDQQGPEQVTPGISQPAGEVSITTQSAGPQCWSGWVRDAVEGELSRGLSVADRNITLRTLMAVEAPWKGRRQHLPSIP